MSVSEITKMGQLFDSFPERPKPRSAIAFLILTSAVALSAPPLAQATVITATINGSVSSGTDVTGVFGPANSSLANVSFKLVYSIDDSKGFQTVLNNFLGVPVASGIFSDVTNPITATLTINTQSISVTGTPLNIGVNAGAFRSTVVGLPPGGEALFNIGVDYNNSVVDAFGLATVSAVIFFNNPPTTVSYDWRSPLSYDISPIPLIPGLGVENSGGSFSIDRGNSIGAVISNLQEVSGTLVPSSLVIGGPATLPISPFTAAEKAIFAIIGPAMKRLADVFTVMSIVLAPLDQAIKLAVVAVYQNVIVRLAESANAAAGEFLGSAVDIANLFGEINQSFLKYLATKGHFELIGILLAFDAFEADQIAALSAKIVIDPPDPNFQTVAPPSNFAVILPSGFPVGPELAGCASAQSSFATTIALLEAGLTASERYQGAVIAGDNSSADMQLAAFNSFIGQSQTSASSLNADLGSCLVDLQTLGFPDPQEVAAIIKSALNQPLDGDVVSALSPIGVDQPTLNSLVAQAEGDLLSPSFGANPLGAFADVKAGLENFAGPQSASSVNEPSSIVTLLSGLYLLAIFRIRIWYCRLMSTLWSKSTQLRQAMLDFT